MNSMQRAIGIVRVSRTKGEGIVSPSEQRERIEAACERDGLELLEVIEELDVSGGTPLEKRRGLSQAVSKVEAGEADTIVVAYFDRLVRSLAVQAEIVSRVEAAGGGILAVDVGQVTNGSSAQWLSGNVLGLVAEYQRRTTAERTEEAKRRAIARGVPTFDRIPPGYRRRDDRTLERDPETASIVQEAFRLRAQGAAIKDVQSFLRENGIERGFTGTQTMLASRIYLGELHFGALENLHAHEPLIDPALFRRVQELVVPTGRKPKSERLLARQGILRCGTCGSQDGRRAGPETPRAPCTRTTAAGRTGTALKRTIISAHHRRAGRPRGGAGAPGAAFTEAPPSTTGSPRPNATLAACRAGTRRRGAGLQRSGGRAGNARAAAPTARCPRRGAESSR